MAPVTLGCTPTKELRQKGEQANPLLKNSEVPNSCVAGIENNLSRLEQEEKRVPREMPLN